MTIDPSTRLRKGREAAEAGRHQEALDAYVWFHHHALEHRPSLYGVRLSFALRDWMELGEHYPKALEELEGICERKTAQLLAGEHDKHLFHDVSSINEVLGKEGATYELFVALEREAAEFAVACAHIAMPAIVDAGDHTLARRYLGDPRRAVEVLSRGFARLVQMGGEHEEDEDEEMREARFHAIVSNHAEGLQRVLDVVQAAGEDVAGLRDQALHAIGDEDLRRAVSQALRT